MAKYRLTGPDGAKYEVTAPDEATEEEVLARFTKEVGQALPALGAGDRATRRYRHQLTMGLADIPSDAWGAFANKAAGQADDRGFYEEYKRQRALTKANVGASLDPLDIAADTAGQTTLAVATAPLQPFVKGYQASVGGLRLARDQISQLLSRGAPQEIALAEGTARLAAPSTLAVEDLTRKQIAQGSGRVGAVFGSAGAAGKDHETFGEALADTATHTTGGYLLGRALPGAINLAHDYVVQPLRNLKAARAERAAGVARDFEEAGISEPPAYTMAGPTVRNLAAGLDDTLTGSSIRGAALPRIQELEAAIVREIEAAGGVATPAQVGEKIQEFLRNQVAGRSRTPEEVQAMTPLELYGISGVPPGPHYNPSPPRVAPGVPRDVGRVTPEQVLEEAALVPEVQPRAVTSVEGRYKEPTIADVELTPDLVKRVQDSSVAVADAQRRVQAEQELIAAAEAPFKENMKRVGFEEVYSSNQGDRWVAILHDETGTIPRNQRFVMVGADGKLQAGQPTPEQAAFLNEFLPWMQTKRRELYKGLDKSRAAAEAAEQERAITQREAEIYRVQQLPGLADRQRAQAMADAEAEAAAQASRDTQQARSASVEQARAGAVSEAARRTEAAQTEEAQRVAQETERRQAAANAEFEAQLAEARASLGAPIRLGQGRGQSYQTELDAAYEANRRNAPSVQRNPLGSKGNDEHPDEPTNVSDLIERFALEGRRKGQQEGFKEGQLFDESGRLSKETLDYLRPKLGDEVTNLLVYLSEHRAKGQLTPGMQGLQDMRTMVGQRIRQLGNDAPPELKRLYQAIDQDIDDFARGAGERGDIYRTQREQIDRAYEQFINDIKKPLETVFGERVDSAATLATLVKDTQKGGKIDRLDAFYRVLTDKGDRLLGTGWLLNDMARGGLEGFLTAYRGLSPDARRIMFQGPAAELGQRLDAMARAGGHLERYAKAARGEFRVDLRPSNVGAALFGYLNLPLAIKTAIGAEGLARLISSKWFGGWLKAYPVDKVPHSTEWKSHMARFRGLATETLGLSDAAGESLVSALSFGTVQAGPTGPAISGRKPAEPEPLNSGSEWVDNLPRIKEAQDETGFSSWWMPVQPDYTSRDDNSFKPDMPDGRGIYRKRGRRGQPDEERYFEDENGELYLAPSPYPHPLEGDKGLRQKISMTEEEEQPTPKTRVPRHYVGPTPERRSFFLPLIDEPRGGFQSEPGFLSLDRWKERIGWPGFVHAFRRLSTKEGQYRPGEDDTEGVDLANQAAVGVTGSALAGGALANRSGLWGGAGGLGMNWTPQAKAVLKEMDGRPVAEVAEALGVTEQTIKGARHRLRDELELGKHGHAKTELTPEMQRRIKEGAPLEQITNELGVDVRTLYNARKRANMESRAREKPFTPEMQEQYQNLIDDGVPFVRVAKELGVDWRTLDRMVHDAGMTPVKLPPGMRRKATREPEVGRGRKAETRLDYDAMDLEKALRGFEDSLRKAGKSPDQIAKAMNEKFGEQVTGGITGADLKSRNVWWRIGEASDHSPGSAVQFEDWMSPSTEDRLWMRGLPLPPPRDDDNRNAIRARREGR